MTKNIGADRFQGQGDEFYDILRSVHQGLSFEESAALNARLVLILANLIADIPVLKNAVAAADAAKDRHA